MKKIQPDNVYGYFGLFLLIAVFLFCLYLLIFSKSQPIIFAVYPLMLGFIFLIKGLLGLTTGETWMFRHDHTIVKEKGNWNILWTIVNLIIALLAFIATYYLYISY